MQKKKIILHEDTQPVVHAIGVPHTACEDEFATKNSISQQLELIYIFRIRFS